MAEPAGDLVEIKDEIQEITPEEAEAHPELLADQDKAEEGVLDDADPEFEAHELEAAADVIMGGEGAGAAAGGAAASGAAAGSSITAHQLRALALALTQKGIRETPPGTNNNPYSRYFGFGKQEWCADFVSFCVDKTGDGNHKVPWGYPSAVSNITAWGQRNRRIFNQPQKGDIFTRKDGMHTGFVLNARGSSFMTIEGNTSGPLGDVYVATHSRDASSGLYYFVRWHF
jgi:CHAP domain